MRWWLVTYPKMTLKKAMDVFADTVENYKNCSTKDKLYYDSLSFITAINIMRIDFLTGAQALEVANNVATDFGASKVQVQAQIDKIMKGWENDKGYSF